MLNVTAWDWHRILIGDAAWPFTIEILLRTAIIYLLLLVMMRLMGRRVAAQLSVSELAVMITLGAAIGVPLQTPEKGILPAAVLLLTALIFQRGLSFLSFKKRAVEVAVQGDATVLVKDGRLVLDNVAKARLSPERIHSELRSQNIQHLGEVRRVYLESSGRFSLIKYRTPYYGLWLLPTPDPEMSKRIQVNNHYACTRCGHVIQCESQTPQEKCDWCANEEWLPAVKRLGVKMEEEEAQKTE
ncbi:uncharacterized protein DUF421 [Pseudomonas duriflava]|uniref:Uncharacterized protein DUF421 n=1 Tax=Pseudomonas duriflava TaxID=459528 RepID=A0A562Q2Q7_9PSED|nr:YetF domain-containing protein [Pseudomonas duriflava]TWI50932.1 uncharacterized protein DUF421 [Pseudomonas duriflava]